jgi:hypothetical protein
MDDLEKVNLVFKTHRNFMLYLSKFTQCRQFACSYEAVVVKNYIVPRMDFYHSDNSCDCKYAHEHDNFMAIISDVLDYINEKEVYFDGYNSCDSLHNKNIYTQLSKIDIPLTLLAQRITKHIKRYELDSE